MKPAAYRGYETVPDKGTLRRNASYIGERLELKVQRMFNNNEPITDSAPLIYTERKDGVLPAYDIRTDRFDIAIEAMDKGSKSYRATREERQKPVEKKETTDPVKLEGGVKPEKPS